jgi:hypothetical protein
MPERLGALISKQLIMKQVIFFLVSLQFCGNIFCQGITLLYRGPSGWSDPASWIQINTPANQTPIQRVPTELDDVVISKSLSGLFSAEFYSDNINTDFFVGSNNTKGYRCRSMHISNTEVTFENGLYSGASINISTSNGGFVIIDSASNVRHGHFYLHGGSPNITDLKILHSNYGELFSMAIWSGVSLDSNAKAKFLSSKVAGFSIGSRSGGEIYADSCTFETEYFILGDNSTDTILNSTITNNINNLGFDFFIGRNANFVSEKVNVEPFEGFNFTSSGSVLNGNVTTILGYAGNPNFLQEDPANPLPNIINGNVFVGEVNSIGIVGDLKISGNLTGHSDDFYNNPTQVFVNAQQVFEVSGITNYQGNASINNCMNNFCHYKLEFFGSTNSNIDWLGGFPIDTLIVNKTGCAKVTSSQSLYVSGATRIENGQLALDPNDTIAYKFVCLGDLEIMQGGGIFLRKNNLGVAANMAIQGNLYDHNPAGDSSCVGINNPYAGNITLYQNSNNGGNNIIDIPNITNLHLIGRPGSGFILGNDLTVYDSISIDAGELNLNNHKLVVKRKILNRY